MSCTPLHECVACGSKDLELVLDLGSQPLANSFKMKLLDVQEEYPLAINRCNKCNHVQLTHSVDPHLMFDDYLYVSGTAKTMHQHFIDFAAMTLEIVPDAKNVLDIGCNDGTQLDYYKQNHNLSTYGIDPAQNLYDLSSKNHRVYCNYLNDGLVNNLEAENKTFDIITAQNVFAHGPDPLGFLKNCRRLMNDNSVLFIQTSQARMIQNNEFDTIYHEHVSFFNTMSMEHLCERADMWLSDVKFMPIHGTSYIFVITKKPLPDFRKIGFQVAKESLEGLYEPETYVEYAKTADRTVKDLIEIVNGYGRPDMGWFVVGYGAPAKGMTLLNYAKKYGGLHLDFIIDDNPLKQGRFTPGSSITIYSSDVLKNYTQPILFVPLAWNFFTEIKSKIKQMRPETKDKFVLYFPKVEVFE